MEREKSEKEVRQTHPLLFHRFSTALIYRILNRISSSIVRPGKGWLPCRFLMAFGNWLFRFPATNLPQVFHSPYLPHSEQDIFLYCSPRKRLATMSIFDGLR